MQKIIDKTEIIFRKLAQVPYDKALHFLYGHLVFNFLLIFLAPLIALLITAVVAAAKEFYDYKVPGHEYSFMDWVYTIAPGIIQTLVGLI